MACQCVSSLCSFGLGETRAFTWSSKLTFASLWIQERFRQLAPSWSPDWITLHGPYLLETGAWAVLCFTWALQPAFAVCLDERKIRTGESKEDSFVAQFSHSISAHRVLVLELMILFVCSFEFGIPCSHLQLGRGFFAATLIGILAAGRETR